MGKNKKKTNSSVFKVAGAKSLKAKAKAKPVTGNLKNVKLFKHLFMYYLYLILLQIHVKNKIAQTDKQFQELQDQVRQIKKNEISKKIGEEKNKTLTRKNGEDYEVVKQKSQEALKTMKVLKI